MALVEPATRSPGYLVLVYGTSTRKHKTGMRLVDGVDLDNEVLLRSKATEWSVALGGILPVTQTVTDWELHDENHIRLYNEPLGAVVIGSHGSSGNGTVAQYSRTLAFSGAGVGPTVHTQRGQWIGRVFVGEAFAWLAGQKFYHKDDDAAVAALWQFYEDCTIGPADYYGQHVEMRVLCPVQHNGYAQNHWGE